jgi:hypothetical protein
MRTGLVKPALIRGNDKAGAPGLASQGIGGLISRECWQRFGWPVEPARIAGTRLTAFAPAGIVLCADKNNSLVEYATAGLAQEIFVRKYLVQLPSVEELKQLIEKDRMALYPDDL